MNRRSASGGDGPLFAWGDALRAAKLRRKRLVRRGATIAIGGVIVLASAVFPPAPRLVWNASASAPVGLYRVQPGAPIAAGDTVLARLPQSFRRFAAERRYLPANVPLVKRAVATAGDDVCAVGSRILVAGVAIAERRRSDRSGRRLPQWSGCRLLGAGQLLLLMDDPDSFDGRYFGVTDSADVLGKATLLWAR